MLQIFLFSCVSKTTVVWYICDWWETTVTHTMDTQDILYFILCVPIFCAFQFIATRIFFFVLFLNSIESRLQGFPGSWNTEYRIHKRRVKIFFFFFVGIWLILWPINNCQEASNQYNQYFDKKIYPQLKSIDRRCFDQKKNFWSNNRMLKTWWWKWTKKEWENFTPDWTDKLAFLLLLLLCFTLISFHFTLIIFSTT